MNIRLYDCACASTWIMLHRHVHIVVTIHTAIEAHINIKLLICILTQTCMNTSYDRFRTYPCMHAYKYRNVNIYCPHNQRTYFEGPWILCEIDERTEATRSLVCWTHPHPPLWEIHSRFYRRRLRGSEVRLGNGSVTAISHEKSQLYRCRPGNGARGRNDVVVTVPIRLRAGNADLRWVRTRMNTIA